MRVLTTRMAALAHADARSHVTYMDGHTDGRSHHTSHSVALDHTYDTHPTAHSNHEPYDAKAGDTTIGQNPVPVSEQSPEPVELRLR